MSNQEPLTLRQIAFALVFFAFFLTCLDHGLRKDQLHECQTTDNVECPAKMWWFVPANR